MINNAAKHAARARVLEYRASQGPVASLLLTLLGFVMLLVVLVIAIPLVLFVAALGLITLLVLAAKRRLAVIGRPNSRVGPVRTDGRDNVRVITRD